MLAAADRAPGFSLPDVDGRGQAFPVGGRLTLLAFFKTTCGTCDVAFPYINRLREAYPHGWDIWAIAQDPPDAARTYAGKHDMAYPVLIDAPAYEASRAYDPEATPTLFLIAPDGAIEYANYGLAKDDLNEIASRIARHLGQPAVIVAPKGDGGPDFKPG